MVHKPSDDAVALTITTKDNDLNANVPIDVPSDEDKNITEETLTRAVVIFMTIKETVIYRVIEKAF